MGKGPSSLRADVSCFLCFTRGAKEIGDVCSQAKVLLKASEIFVKYPLNLKPEKRGFSTNLFCHFSLICACASSTEHTDTSRTFYIKYGATWNSRDSCGCIIHILLVWGFSLAAREEASL